jgi:hypothetical protein
MISTMTRAALALVLVACSTGGSNDFPTRPGGGGIGVVVGGGGGSGGTAGDAGVVGGGDDAGVLVTGRVCIVKDLRTPITCDTTKDASIVKVTLGTRTPAVAPAKTGEFTILAQLSTDLVWHATGLNFVPSVMPFGTDHTIPIVPDTLYTEMQSMNNLTILAEGQGSVLARVVSGVSPVANVAATSTLVSGNVIPLYDTKDGLIWSVTGPTLANGALWFPGVNVTTTPARITFTPQGGAPVSMLVGVEDQAITFVTRDVQ